MYQMAEQLLSLSNEAAAYARHSKIVFVNSAAERVLGCDCVGRSVRSALGPDVAGPQSASFVADVPIGSGRYAVRVAPVGDGQAFFLTPTNIEPPALNEDMISAMRDLLMSINVSCSVGRARAEQLGDEELSDCFTGATRAYYRLARILANVSILEGLAVASFPFQPDEVDLSELCRGIVESLQEIFGGVEIRMNIPHDVFISGDRTLIQEAVMNLLSNCLTHASGLSRISLNLLDCSDRAVLSVTDDGCGMPQSAVNSLFERPAGTDGAIRISRGANTGLRLVRAVAEQHHGSVLIESRPDYGTTVRMSLAKGILPIHVFREPAESYKPSRTLLYTGLADCLPLELFKNTFQD